MLHQNILCVWHIKLYYIGIYCIKISHIYGTCRYIIYIVCKDVSHIWHMSIYLIIVHSVLGFVLAQLEMLPSAVPSLSELQILISFQYVKTISESYIEVVLTV